MHAEIPQLAMSTYMALYFVGRLVHTNIGTFYLLHVTSNTSNAWYYESIRLRHRGTSKWSVGHCMNMNTVTCDVSGDS
jgi:hypothetical protein